MFKLLEIFLTSLIGALLKQHAEARLKKEKDESQRDELQAAIDDYKKAKTREEKAAANRRLSDAFRSK